MNCNTTHYRANSSSVPGDPTDVTKTIFGTLGLGTANDLAVHLGTSSPASLAQAILAGSQRRVDVGTCSFIENGRETTLPFLTTAGVGILADVGLRERGDGVRWMKRALGNAVWPLLFAASWRRVTPAQSELSFDGATFTGAMASFEVCKIPAPGGVVLAPDAGLDTQLLHAFWFGHMPALSLAADMARALTSEGGHFGGGRVHYVSKDPAANPAGACNVREISVAPAHDLPVHVHGEHVGTTPAHFRLTPASVELFAAT